MLVFRTTCVRKQGIMCTAAFERRDKGLLVLEDLKDPNRSNGPMMSLNKARETTEMDKTLLNWFLRSETMNLSKRSNKISKHIQNLCWLIKYEGCSWAISQLVKGLKFFQLDFLYLSWFRFSIYLLECSVHICSCPWIRTRLQMWKLFTLLWNVWPDFMEFGFVGWMLKSLWKLEVSVETTFLGVRYTKSIYIFS